MLHAIDSTHLIVEIDVLYQVAVFHLPFRTAMEYLGLGLELQYRDGLVHLGYEVAGLLVELTVVLE